jgi:hypothetical protein
MKLGSQELRCGSVDGRVGGLFIVPVFWMLSFLYFALSELTCDATMAMIPLLLMD